MVEDYPLSKTKRILKNQEIREETAYYEYYDSLMIPLCQVGQSSSNNFGTVAAFSIYSKGMFSKNFVKRIKKCSKKINVLTRSVYDFIVDKYPKLI